MALWLCWIPILTPSVDYPRRLKGFFAKPDHQGANGKYTFSLLLNDVDDGKSTVEIFPDLVKGHVVSIKIDGIFDIAVEQYFPNGLVIFSFKNQFDTFESERHAAKQIYVILKRIYHEHTHHHRDDDMLLLPEAIDSGSEEKIKGGVEGIITQYDEKIIRYHRSLRWSRISSARAADNILTEFNKGLGEMLYAEHFLKLISGRLEAQYYDDHRAAFRSSLASFQQILSVFSSRLEKKNLDVAYAVIILSACIFLIGGISPFFKNMPINNFIVHMVVLVLFLGIYWGLTHPKE